MTTILALLLAADLQAKPKAAAPKTPGIVWQVSEGLSEPESALYDGAHKCVYISNVAGKPHEKDGKGWITKVSASGKVMGAQWVSGLNAPKGMRRRGNRLFVADIDEIVEIDVKKGEVTRKIKVEGAQLLNDVDTDAWGNVWVSDTMGSRIYKLPSGGDKAELFMEGPELESPNGLFIKKGKIFVAAWGLAAPDWSTKTPGRLLAVDIGDKTIEALTEPLGNLDGLEPTKDGAWLVSDWSAGKVYRVAGGKAQVILSGFKGAADIGYTSKGDLLLVPRMGENRVTAYRLSRLPKPKKN